MQAFIDYCSQNYMQIFDLLIGHVQLTVMAILIAIIIGVPLGIFITYFKPSKKPIMASVSYTHLTLPTKLEV